MARVVVNIPDSVDLSKVNDIKLYIRYCKDNDEYSYVTDGFSIQEERPQGEWITRYKQNSFGRDVVCFECNKCGKYTLPIIYTMITEPLGVCPNCGKRMMKGGKEE